MVHSLLIECAVSSVTEWSVTAEERAVLWVSNGLEFKAEDLFLQGGKCGNYPTGQSSNENLAKV